MSHESIASKEDESLWKFVRMHGWLICIAFRLSGPLSVTGPKVTRPKIKSQQPFNLGSWNWPEETVHLLIFCPSKFAHLTDFECIKVVTLVRWAHFNVKLHFLYFWMAPDVNWSLNDVNFWKSWRHVRFWATSLEVRNWRKMMKKYQSQRTTVYMQCTYSVGAVYTAVCSVSAVYPFLYD